MIAQATQIVPRGTNVLIKVEPAAKISDIIELPEDSTAIAKPIGIVLAVGPQVTEVSPGDTVHFEQFDHTVAGKDQIIIEEGEILAKEETDES